jgi:hypothetical protein
MIVRNAGIYLLITTSNQGQDYFISKWSRFYSGHYQYFIISDNCHHLLPVSCLAYETWQNCNVQYTRCFLISNFCHVLNVVFFLLGDSLASEFHWYSYSYSFFSISEIHQTVYRTCHFKRNRYSTEWFLTLLLLLLLLLLFINAIHK